MVTVILMFYLPFCIGLDVAKILFLCLSPSPLMDRTRCAFEPHDFHVPRRTI